VEDEKSKGKFNLTFDDGSLELGVDLVVSADGAWSKVRPLLTTENPSIPVLPPLNFGP